MLWKNTAREPEPCYKKNSSGAGAGAMLTKTELRTPSRSHLIFTRAPQPWLHILDSKTFLTEQPVFNTFECHHCIYRVFHSCWNKAIGHKSRILNDTTMMITFIETWKDNILQSATVCPQIRNNMSRRVLEYMLQISTVAEICSDSDRLTLEP